MVRQSTTNRLQTWRMARPLSDALFDFDLRHSPLHLGAREFLSRLLTALNLLPYLGGPYRLAVFGARELSAFAGCSDRQLQLRVKVRPMLALSPGQQSSG
jgi:hypothetical protein